MNSRPVLLGLGALLVAGVLGMGLSESHGAPSKLVCGDRLCAEIAAEERERAAEQKAAMEARDKMAERSMAGYNMTGGDGLSGKAPAEAIRSIVDATDYTPDGMKETVMALADYVAGLDAAALEQQPVKNIANVVFYAKYGQTPPELAIYDIYEMLG